jgi:ribosomal-protein-alanine N-acetyltransferase
VSAPAPTRLEIRTAAHARALFPHLHRSPVMDTLVWEGPEDAAAFEEAYADFGARTRRGEAHEFTIVDASGAPVGCLSVRPSAQAGRGDLGILVTLPHQGRGHGTRAVGLALDYAFARLGWAKCDASVFVGNDASRAIFEHNGFRLEGTIRKAVEKRGRWLDEWFLGITRDDWEARGRGD